MVNKVLITGVSGLLGSYLLHHIRSMLGSQKVRGTWCTVQVANRSNALYNYHMDITNLTEVERIMYRYMPDVVIHCAAAASVDYCETQWIRSRAVNVDGTKNVMSVAKDIGAKFVFISSNAVYQGDAAPYNETDRCVPVNKYGWQKVTAEDVVLETLDDPLIVRPIMLYGWPCQLGRGNWVTKILKWIDGGATLYMVNDIITQPTYVGDVAESIWTLIELGQGGTWNVSSPDCMTLYDLAYHVVDVFETKYVDGQIVAVDSDYFPTIAPRPVNTTFDLVELNSLADEYPQYRGMLVPKGIVAGLTEMRIQRDR